MVDDRITPAMQAPKVFHEMVRSQAGDFSRNRGHFIGLYFLSDVAMDVENCD